MDKIFTKSRSTFNKMLAIFFVSLLFLGNSEAQVTNPDVTFDSLYMTTYPTPLGLAPRVIGGRVFKGYEVQKQPKNIVWYLSANTNIPSGYAAMYYYDLSTIPNTCSSPVGAFPISGIGTGQVITLSIPHNHTRRPPGLYSDHVHINSQSGNPFTFTHPVDNYVGPPLSPSHPGCAGVTIAHGVYNECEAERIFFDPIPLNSTFPQGSVQTIKIRKNIQEDLNVHLIDLITQDTLAYIANGVEFDSIRYLRTLGTCPAIWNVANSLVPGLYQFEAISPYRTYEDPNDPNVQETYTVSGVSDPFMVGNCINWQPAMTLPATAEAALATQALCFAHLIQPNQSAPNNAVQGIKLGEWAQLVWNAVTIRDTNKVYLSNYLPSPMENLPLSGTHPYWWEGARAMHFLDYQDGGTALSNRTYFFQHEEIVTRGRLIKTLLDMWNIKPDYTASTTNAFNDVPVTHGFYPWIKKAKDLNILRDITGNFNPDAICTREQAYVWLFRVFASYKTPQRILRPNPTDADFLTPGNYQPSVMGLGAGSDNGDLTLDGDSPFVVNGGGMGQAFSFGYASNFNEMPEEFRQKWDATGNKIYDFERMGKGWDHNYNHRIVEVSNFGTTEKRLAICWAGGSVDIWNPSTQQYITEGVYDNLTIISNTEIEIKTKSQTIYRFKRTSASQLYYILDYIQDRFNNKTNLVWSGSKLLLVSDLPNPAANYQGRPVFDFAYNNTTGVLVSVTDLVTPRADPNVEFSVINDTLNTYTNNVGGTHNFDYVNRVFATATQTESTGRAFLKLKKTTSPGGSSIFFIYKKGKIFRVNKGILSDKQEFKPYYKANPPYIESISDDQVSSQTTTRFDMLRRMTSVNGPTITSSVTSYGAGKNIFLPLSTTSNGITVTNQFTADGDLLSTTETGGTTTITESYTYNTLHDVLTHTNGRGFTVNYIRNAQTGILTSTKTPLGFENKIIQRTPTGQIIKSESPSGIQTVRTYHAQHGNLIKIAKPQFSGIETNYHTDAAGRPINIIDGLGTNSGVGLSDDDMVSSVTNVNANQTHNFNYDANRNNTGNDNAVTENETTPHSPNEDLPTCQTFGNSQVCVSYRSDGSFQSITKLGQTKNFVYDHQTSELLTGPDVVYTYDSRHRMASAENTRFNIELKFTYDDLNRLIEVQEFRFGQSTPKSKVGYAYDANDNVTYIYYDGLGGNKWVNYVYDADDRVVEVKDWILQNTPRASYFYHTDGRVDYVVHANGTKEKHFYDAIGRWLGLEHQPKPGVYTSNLTQYNMIAYHRADLDLVGKHLREGYGVSGWGAAQPQIPQEPTSYGPSPYNRMEKYVVNGVTYLMDYDGAGNVSKIGNYTFDWTFNDQLQTIRLNGQIVGENTYDAMGTRRSKTLNGNTVDFLMDVMGSGNVLGTSDQNGQNLYYIHGPTGLIAMVQDNSTNAYYFHGDMRGSTIAITNENAQITHAYAYDAWGKVIHSKIAPGAANAPFIRFLYNGIHGVQYEGVADLIFMRARYYHQPTGRFLSEDSEWDDNIYAFASNSPINHYDPTGEFLETVADVISAGASIYEAVKNPSVLNIALAVWDVAAVVVPGMPGSYALKALKYVAKAGALAKGAEYAAKMTKAVTKVVTKGYAVLSKTKNMQKAIRKGREFEKQVLKAIGGVNFRRNVGETIPDFIDEFNNFTEIKDVKKLYATKQLRLQVLKGNSLSIVVSPKTTHISSPVIRMVKESGGNIRIFDPIKNEFKLWKF